jgi:flagellar export protein FliJ
VVKKFRLAALLRVRKLREEQKLREFGEATQALERGRAQRTAAAAELAREQDAYNRATEGGESVQDLRVRETYLQVCRERLRRADQQVAELVQAREAKLNELTLATRNREVVDSLRERFEDRVAYEMEKTAEKQLAETALDRFVRRSRSVE